ncbi:MAG: hypothetical protein JWN44_1420 [Myxococcales bacterium]|nr:hypothetical protein [Myxococcales bacterium]
MRVLVLVVVAATGGCAAPIRSERAQDLPCLYEVGRPHAIASDYQLIRGGHRVPGDDLLSAVADVNDARTLAARSQLDQWIGIGALVLGPVLFAPGVALLGYGIADHQDGSIAGGAILTVIGAGGIVAGAVLLTRSDRERERALAAYNAQHALSCRP